MFKIIKTDSGNKDFIELVKMLDADLAEKDGNEHSFYAQFNEINNIKHVVIAYKNKKAVACGAIKEFDSDTMEVKRMFTLPEYRGKGIAAEILSALEIWAKELQYKKCILETGKRQLEAISLYTRNGYKRIGNYGQYINVENSICFKKELE